MTLSYRHERVLRTAERALRQSDPDLAAMLSVFARVHRAERLPAREQLRPKLTFALSVLLWPAAGCVFIVIFAGGGGSRAARSCTLTVHRCALRWCLHPLRRADRLAAAGRT